MESIKKGLENLIENKINTKDEIITLTGKYRTSSNENFLGELICQTLPSITLIKGDNPIDINLIDRNFYKFVGKLKLAPDRYSDKAKFYLQMQVQDIYEVTTEDSQIFKKYLEARNKIEKIECERKKEDILTEDKIIKSLADKKELKFLYIVSEKGNNGNNDILDDLYTSTSKNKKIESKQKNNLFSSFGIDFEKEENILRTKFTEEEWKKTLIKIEKYRKEKDYSAVVFIKGGGSTTSFFDDELFCLSVLELGLPIITAIGHSKDDDRLLCQLADINYKTPSYLGQSFLKLIYMNFSTSKDKKLEIKDKEISKLKEKLFIYEQDKKLLNKEIENLQEYEYQNRKLKEEISNLKSNNHIFEENTKILNRKIKTRNILLLFLIPLVILLNIIYLSFFNPKNISSQSTKEPVKEEIKPKKESNNNLIEKVKEKISQKVEDKKIIKEEKTKRLIYSEDDVYTVLLWKGYKGEQAISNFQKDNNMKVTGKVDEILLKKLGIKYRYE